MSTNQGTNTVKPDHELKSWPGSFSGLWDGSKSYEWRKNDRSYGIGDVLLLKERIPHDDRTGTYTGRTVLVRVVHMTSGAYEMPTGFCVLGIEVYNREP